MNWKDEDTGMEFVVHTRYEYVEIGITGVDSMVYITYNLHTYNLTLNVCLVYPYFAWKAGWGYD